MGLFANFPRRKTTCETSGKGAILYKILFNCIWARYNSFYEISFIESAFTTYKTDKYLLYNASLLKILFIVTCATKMVIDFRKAAKYLTSFAF